MLHLFKAIVGTARIPQRIVRTTLCAVWRPSQPSHYNSRDLADELRRRQLSLSGQKGRDNLMTDMVRSMATAPRADPADQSESDSDVPPETPPHPLNLHPETPSPHPPLKSVSRNPAPGGRETAADNCPHAGGRRGGE